MVNITSSLLLSINQQHKLNQLKQFTYRDKTFYTYLHETLVG